MLTNRSFINQKKIKEFFKFTILRAKSFKDYFRNKSNPLWGLKVYYSTASTKINFYSPA